MTDKGYKLLDQHVNLIYGDSITLERAEAICAGLKAKGFVPKMILGIGSFTYQYNTRDTFGFAMKATAGIVNGELREIFKDPATDDGTKKSAKGLLAVFETENGFELVEGATWEQVRNCAFEQVFTDGEMVKTHTLSEIRERVNAN